MRFDLGHFLFGIVVGVVTIEAFLSLPMQIIDLHSSIGRNISGTHSTAGGKV
jgi:hypothetical protein